MKPSGRARSRAGTLETALLRLQDWFERQKRVLPWRSEPTLYRVWVSEIMLQQTQVATVVPYFERFIARFPSVEALAKAPLDDVLLHWAGLGYYSRARNLHRAAQKIVEQGTFPRTREEWLEIPGVGGYTAGAILSIALDRPEAILDGNVERVLSRVRKIGRQPSDAAFKARLWRLSRIFVKRGHAFGVRPSVLNQALMELGATLCSPRAPKCVLCPLSGICRASRDGAAEAYPPRKARKEWVTVREELHCVLDGQGRVLLRQRGAGEWRAGLWDLWEGDPPEGARKLGELETRYVVTRHKILRRTQVWRLPQGADESFLPGVGRGVRHGRSSGWRAGEPAFASDGTFRWISFDRPEVAVGAPLRKVLAAIKRLELNF